jgi:parallel beta-helix repeat protein
MRTKHILDARIVISVGVFLLLTMFPLLGLEMPVVTVELNAVTAPSDTQIQKALDKLPAAGGTVALDPGVYEIHHPLLLLRNGLTLQGSGNLTVLHLADRANCPVLILGSLMDKPSHIVHDLHVSDLFIDGNRHHQMMEQWLDRLNTSGIENNGLMIQGVSNSTVERVVAAHCRSGGLVTANDTRNLTVSEFTAFDSQFDGLACYETENSVFTKLNLHDNQCAGISLDLDFNHNLISDSTLSGNDLGIFMRDSFGNQFLNLSISQSRHDGVFMAQWVQSAAKGWAYIPQTECTDNQFDGLRIHDCAGEAFCIHDPTCIRNAIQDGIFTGNVNNDLALAAVRLSHLPVLLATKNH